MDGQETERNTNSPAQLFQETLQKLKLEQIKAGIAALRELSQQSVESTQGRINSKAQSCRKFN